MSSATQVMSDRWAAKARLSQLGLEEALLSRAVAEGLAAWAGCTPNHPTAAPGFYAWSETTRALRELLIPAGWQKQDEQNQAQVVSADGSIVIVVATGNEATGLSDSSPITKSRKGPQTVSAVAQNTSGFLFEEMEADAIAKAMDSNRNTWLLLINRDKLKGEVRSELSRPIGLDADFRVSGWSERILLSPTPFEPSDRTLPKQGEPDMQTPEIAIEIRRRA